MGRKRSPSPSASTGDSGRQHAKHGDKKYKRQDFPTGSTGKNGSKMKHNDVVKKHQSKEHKREYSVKKEHKTDWKSDSSEGRSCKQESTHGQRNSNNDGIRDKTWCGYGYGASKPDVGNGAGKVDTGESNVIKENLVRDSDKAL